MKKCIIIATVMLLLLCAVSEAVLIWDQVYGGTASEGGRDVIEAIDGGFVIVGFTYSEGNGNSDVYLVKTDTQGNQIWTQTYGGSGWEFGYSLCAAEDGSGYVIAGYTTSSGNGLRDVFLVGTDIAGNQLWTQTYGGADLDEASSIITGHEGGYVVCGYTCSYGAGEDDIYVIGTDNGGNYIWSAVLGTEKSEMGKTIRKTGDGNYIIAGSTGLYDTPGVNSGKSREAYLVKIDNTGAILDENTFWGIDDDQGDHDEAASVCVLPDGGYCLIGGTTAEGVEVMDVLIIKVNADLEEDWKTAIEPGNLHDFGKCVCRYLLDGNLLICGTTRYAQPLTNDLFLVKMDLQGNVVSSDLFGDDGSEGGFALCETAEGNCVVAGQTNSQGNGGYDVWLFMISGVTPDFEAEPHSGVAPQTIQFTDHSLGNIDTWNWDFNSDSIIDSYEQNPSWTFQIPGSYSVTLTVEFGDYSISCFKQDFITVFNLDSALYYSGLESYSKCYADPAINITGPLTIEAWVTPQDWGNFYNKILDKNSFTFFLSESFPVYNEYCLVFQMLHQNGELSRSYTADYSVATAGAQHLAVTYDGDQDIHIYINGVNQELYYLNEPEGTISDNLLDDLYIGNDASCNFPCNGIVDELRVWNIVRTPTEINDNMFYYLSGSENGLVGYFKFNEGNGYEINDLSGNLLPGYISNPQWVQGVILLPVSNDDAEIPQLFRPALFNYPNPFNPVTIFQYYLPESDNVKLQVFNLRGQQVDILVNGYLEAGIHHYSWHAGELPAGIYFGQMITSKIKINRKMVILK